MKSMDFALFPAGPFPGLTAVIYWWQKCMNQEMIPCRTACSRQKQNIK